MNRDGEPTRRHDKVAVKLRGRRRKGRPYQRAKAKRCMRGANHAA